MAEQPAVAAARTAVELHGCCARVSLAEALLSQHIDGVTRAGSAGTKSGSRARFLVMLTMWAPVSRCARLRDQLQLDDEENSEIADRYRQLSSPCSSGRRFANFQRQRGPAGPREHPPYKGLTGGPPDVRPGRRCVLAQASRHCVAFEVVSFENPIFC